MLGLECVVEKKDLNQTGWIPEGVSCEMTKEDKVEV